MEKITYIWCFVLMFFLAACAKTTTSKNNDANSQYKTAKAYYEKKDCNKAFEFMQKAADAGDENAMFDLGTLYFEGCGTEKDENKAKEWRLKSARAARSRMFLEMLQENMRQDTNSLPNIAIIFMNAGQLNEAILKELLKRGLDPNAELEGIPLLNTMSYLNPNEKVIELLIKAGAQVNRKGKGGTTPLMAAVGNNNGKIAQTLIDNGADMLAEDDNGHTFIWHVLESGNTNIKIKAK
jgi:hypothetical protein